MRYFPLIVKRKGNKTIIEMQEKRHSLGNVQMLIGVENKIIRGVVHFKKGVAEVDYRLKGSLCGIMIMTENDCKVYLSECVKSVRDYSELINNLVQTYILIENGQVLSADALYKFSLDCIKLVSNALSVKINSDDTGILPLLKVINNGLSQLPPVYEIQLSKRIIEERLRTLGIEECKQIGKFFLVKFRDRIVIYGNFEGESIDYLITVLGIVLDSTRYDSVSEKQIPVDEGVVQVPVESMSSQSVTPMEFVEAVDDIVMNTLIE